jgi:predicted Zn-dependent protease
MYGNTKFKNEFLDQIDRVYSDSLYKAYLTIFGDSQLGKFERIYNKDIYDFNKDELLDAYSSISMASEASLKSLQTNTNKYVCFAFSKGMSAKTTPATTMITNEDLMKCFSSAKFYERYMTEDEIMEAIANLKNNLDRALIMLLFFKQIKGKNYNDLLALKESDFVLEEKYFMFKDKIIKLEDWEARIIKQAMNQEIYKMTRKDRETEHEIIPSEYLFKQYKDKRSGLKTGVATGEELKRRMLSIKLELSKSYWTLDTIYRSGVANKMLKIQNEWDTRDLKEYLIENDVKSNYYNFAQVLDAVKHRITVENKAYAQDDDSIK